MIASVSKKMASEKTLILCQQQKYKKVMFQMNHTRILYVLLFDTNLKRMQLPMESEILDQK